MVHIQRTEKILDSLVDQINDFELYFEMSDNPKKYSLNYHKKIKIIADLKILTFSQKNYIENKLNKFGKLSWERYFK